MVHLIHKRETTLSSRFFAYSYQDDIWSYKRKICDDRRWGL